MIMYIASFEKIVEANLKKISKKRLKSVTYFGLKNVFNLAILVIHLIYVILKEVEPYIPIKWHVVGKLNSSSEVTFMKLSRREQ